ncbi:MAG: IPT/TIG domain-containing protein, partial [Pseudomonadota bacterium]
LQVWGFRLDEHPDIELPNFTGHISLNVMGVESSTPHLPGVTFKENLVSTVESVQPAIGAREGGTRVSIKGSNFRPIHF